MKSPLLPDRERRHLLQFYFAPRLDYGPRLALAAGLIGGGLMLQLLWPGTMLLPRLLLCLLILAGNLLLLVRGYDLQPKHSLRRGTWEKTTRDRFQQARQLEQQVKSWDETFVDLTCVSGFVALLVVSAAVGGVYCLLAFGEGSADWALLFAADAATLLLPHWVTGTRRGWRPVALRQQIDSLEIALAAIARYETPPCQIQPMFEMAGKGDQRVPISARVFIRFPEAPETFLGLQLQVALNNVQGTHYPYLYAVLIARQGFALAEHHLDALRQIASGLKVEAKTEKDVEVIVLRQRTTKTSGYHTDRAAVVRVATAAWESARHVLAGVAVP